MIADVLLLDDDADYAAVVAEHFGSRTPTTLRLHRALNLESALTVCRNHDIRVAIIDLALGDGALGTSAISEIWRLDKKVIFIIHSVHPPESLAEWSAQTGVPYTSQYFLRKSGTIVSMQKEDSAHLYDLAQKALRAYVPHLPPSLKSVGSVVAIVNRFFEKHPTFRPTAIISNIHRSQDVVNNVALWAADRLARTGFDSTRVAVLITGSFARLESTAPSDADYFVAFDDDGLEADQLSELMQLAYYSFVEVGTWFDRHGISVHGAGDREKHPERIRWHTTTLPTWFPITTLTKPILLGHSTQLELTKQWLLLESATIFNPELVDSIRHRLEEGLGILPRATVRDAVAHSSISESLKMLDDEFDESFRQRPRDSLRLVKHYFMRRVNLFSLHLWLFRCFLDPELFNEPPQRLLDSLQPLPIARIIEFCEFLDRVSLLRGQARRRTADALEAIVNLYAEAAYSFGTDELRNSETQSRNATILNDLEGSAHVCGEHIEAIVATLSRSSIVGRHSELRIRKII